MLGLGGKARYLDEAGEAALIAAIRDAERGNRGEVRVHLEGSRWWQEPLERARQLFHKLGMDRTRDGTGVLLYVSVPDRKGAVYAGPGIHGAADAAFWQEVMDSVAAGFKAGTPTDGLVDAVGRIGDLLRASAPGDDSAGNELPDAVTTS